MTDIGKRILRILLLSTVICAAASAAEPFRIGKEQPHRETGRAG